MDRPPSAVPGPAASVVALRAAAVSRVRWPACGRNVYLRECRLVEPLDAMLSSTGARRPAEHTASSRMDP